MLVTGIFYSLDTGATWTSSSASKVLNYYGVASSSSGAIVAAVAHGGLLLVSNTYGISFDSVTSLGAQDWTSVTSDYSGSQLAATVDSGGLWIGVTTQVPS